MHAYYATAGKNALGNMINAGQQITREEVLRLYTSENGWFTFEEDLLGVDRAGEARRPGGPQQGSFRGPR